MTRMRAKLEVKSQLVHEDRVETDGWTDTTDCISYPANEVGKNGTFTCVEQRCDSSMRLGDIRCHHHHPSLFFRLLLLLLLLLLNSDG